MIHNIPSYITVDESYLLLIESAELDFNNMMTNIAIGEFCTITNNNLITESEGKIKGFINSVIDWIKARWEDIQRVFNKFMDKIRVKVDEFTSKVAKSTLKWIPKKIDALKDKNFGTTYEYPDFENLSTTGGPVFDAVRSYSDNILKVLTSSDRAEDIKKNLEQIDSSFRREFGIGADSKDKAVKTVMEKIIRGNEVTINKEYIKKNYETIVSNCSEYTKVHRALKGTLNVAKKEFDKQIKEIKKKENENDEFSTKLGVVAPYIKKANHYTSTASATILSCTHAKMMKEMGIILRLATTFGKPKNESYVGESQSYQSEIGSLFNFNI